MSAVLTELSRSKELRGSHGLYSSVALSVSFCLHLFDYFRFVNQVTRFVYLYRVGTESAPICVYACNPWLKSFSPLHLCFFAPLRLISRSGRRLQTNPKLFS